MSSACRGRDVFYGHYTYVVNVQLLLSRVDFRRCQPSKFHALDFAAQNSAATYRLPS